MCARTQHWCPCCSKHCICPGNIAVTLTLVLGVTGLYSHDVAGAGARLEGANEDTDDGDDDAGEREGREDRDELDADGDDDAERHDHHRAVQPEVVPRVVVDVAEVRQRRRDVLLRDRDTCATDSPQHGCVHDKVEGGLS